MAEAKEEPKAKEIAPWEEVVPTASGDALPASVVQASPRAAEPSKREKAPWEVQYTRVGTIMAPRASKSTPAQAEVRDVDNFIAKMEGVESGGDPGAKNPESTATGLHQFTASTWKQTVAEMGKDYTLADRKDPEKSREVVRYFTQQNAKAAENDLGRKPTEVDLYMYHFLGKGAAGSFLKAPREDAATEHVTPKVALANRAVFYKGGKPKTVGEVIDGFRRKF